MHEKNVGPRMERPIVVKMTAAEHAQIADTAKRCGLPVSTFLRQVGMNMPALSVFDNEAVIKLIKLEADVRSHGRIVKGYFEGQPGGGRGGAETHHALQRMGALEAEMAELVVTLDRAVARRR